MTPQFYNEVRDAFGPLDQNQVNGFEVLGKALLEADLPITHRAYLLATAWHETAYTMQPIHERGKVSYFNKYEPGTTIGKRLGNTVKGDGYRFRGRGYVQLTGRDNYVRAGKALGIDLVGNPELALEPDVAARILIQGCSEGWFTGKALRDYADYKNMRRVVNGVDKAEAIARHARVFQAALEAEKAAKPAPAPKPAPSESWLVAFFRWLLTGRK